MHRARPSDNRQDNYGDRNQLLPHVLSPQDSSGGCMTQSWMACQELSLLCPFFGRRLDVLRTVAPWFVKCEDERHDSASAMVMPSRATRTRSHFEIRRQARPRRT
ncbi:hypothetical protein VTO73DRAFT_8825 [Trametes versicolor]